MDGNLAIKTTNKFSIISVVNWDNYQGAGEVKPPAKPPTNRQQPTTDKNDKNEKKKTGDVPPTNAVNQNKCPHNVLGKLEGE